MPALLQIGLANAVCAAVLAALAVVAGRWCRRPALTHSLWLLVLLKLITPPVWPLSLPWLPEATPEPALTAPAAPVAQAEEPERPAVLPPVPAPPVVEKVVIGNRFLIKVDNPAPPDGPQVAF